MVRHFKMKLLKRLTLIFGVFFLSESVLLSDTPYFLDFQYILNESDAGKKAQSFLQNKLDKGIKNLQVKEKKIQEEEKKIIQQKKVVSPEEYKKKVNQLRTKVSSLRKEREDLLNSVSTQRKKARDTLLKNLKDN